MTDLKSSKYQMDYHFIGFIFKTGLSSKKGCILAIDTSSVEKTSEESSIRINTIVDRWVIRYSTIDYYNQMDSLFRVQSKTKVFSTEIQNLQIYKANLNIRLFETYNLSKFDNIDIQYNKIKSQKSLFEAQFARSFNVTIDSNLFHYRLFFLSIFRSIPISKTQALVQSYQSRIRQWSVYKNSLAQQYPYDDSLNKYRSLIYYDFVAYNSEISSNVKSEIDILKNNLGLRINNITVSYTGTGAFDDSLGFYQNLRVIFAKNAFSFQLTDAKFIENLYLTPNQITDVSYVDISRIVIYRNKFQKATNDFFQSNHGLMFLQRIFDIPYFFMIRHYYDIHINDIQAIEMTFQMGLFRIEQQYWAIKQSESNGYESFLNVKNVLIDQIILKSSVRFGTAMIHVSQKEYDKPLHFVFQNSTIVNSVAYQQMYIRDDMASIVYFSDPLSNRSQFIARNISIKNNCFQYRKGLFVIQSQKVIFQNIIFDNN